MSATVWCDGHDAPAAFEADWIDLTDPRDPRGASTPFCTSNECQERVLGAIADAGELLQVTAA